VRVERIAVGELEPVVLGSQLGQTAAETGHRGVDVEPSPLGAAELADSPGPGRKAIEEVVPAVATTQQGTSPASRST